MSVTTTQRWNCQTALRSGLRCRRRKRRTTQINIIKHRVISSRASVANLRIPRDGRKYAGLSNISRFENNAGKVKANGRKSTQCSTNYRQRCTQYQGRGNRNSLDSIRSCHGYVPWRTTSVPDYADGTMVKRCIPTLHSETNRTI